MWKKINPENFPDLFEDGETVYNICQKLEEKFPDGYFIKHKQTIKVIGSLNHQFGQCDHCGESPTSNEWQQLEIHPLELPEL